MLRKHLMIVSLMFMVTAALPAGAAEPDAGDDIAREKEAVRQAAEEMRKELAKNKEAMDVAVREMLKEARKNKDALKGLFRDLGRNRDELRATIKDLVSDPELRKSLNELSDIIRDAGKEFSKPGGSP